MDDILRNTIELFADNVNKYEKKFALQNVFFKRTAALLFAFNNQEIPLDTIKSCYDLIKRKQKWYSLFRWGYHFLLSAFLALEEDSEKSFDNILLVYQDLKKFGFRSSLYLVLLSYFLAKKADIVNYELLLRRTKLIYEGMKKYHSFLTYHRDYIMAGVLATSEYDYALLLKKAEKHYQSLRSSFHRGYRLWELSHILCLFDDLFDVERKLLSIKDKLKEKGIKMNRGPVMSFLGVLALLPGEGDEIADLVESVYQQLLKYKAFNNFIVLRQEVLIYAAAIATWHYSNDSDKRRALAVDLKDLIIVRLVLSIAALAEDSRSTT